MPCFKKSDANIITLKLLKFKFYCFVGVFFLSWKNWPKIKDKVKCSTQKKELLWREIVLLQNVEVEKGGGQAHSDVHGRHLILLHGGSDIAEETEQRLQHLPVFI